MGKNPVVAVIAVIVLIVAVVLIVKNMSGGGPKVQVGDVFWYDTGDKKLYPAPQTELPPMTAPSGQEGVMAYVFTEGSCDNANERFIGFLEKHPDKEAFKQAGGLEGRIALLERRLVRRPEDAEWIAAGTPEGQELTNMIMQYKQCREYVK